LSTDFSVFLTKRTDFDCGFFRFPGLDTRVLLLISAFEMGLTAGQQDVLPPRKLGSVSIKQIRLPPKSNYYVHYFVINSKKRVPVSQ
jgi:hypothetical protein